MKDLSILALVLAGLLVLVPQKLGKGSFSKPGEDLHAMARRLKAPAGALGKDRLWRLQ